MAPITGNIIITIVRLYKKPQNLKRYLETAYAKHAADTMLKNAPPKVYHKLLRNISGIPAVYMGFDLGTLIDSNAVFQLENSHFWGKAKEFASYSLAVLKVLINAHKNGYIRVSDHKKSSGKTTHMIIFSCFVLPNVFECFIFSPPINTQCFYQVCLTGTWHRKLSEAPLR